MAKQVKGDINWLGTQTINSGVISEVLLAAENVSTDVTTKQTLFTVPTGKTCILSNRVLLVTGSTAPTGDGSGGIGSDANATDFITPVTYPSAANKVKYPIKSTGGTAPVYQPGDVIGWKATADTTTTTVKIYLYGFLI